MAGDHGAADRKAVVLFSGGQDSTTCLAWALGRFALVETVGFDYGQRHRVELDCRLAVLAELRQRFPQWRDRLGEDHLVDLHVLGRLSETALTREAAIVMGENGLPSTFVPGRNLAFLTFAGAIAYRRGARHLVIGAGETDYSGYPDCRAETMAAMEHALSLGMAQPFVVDAPLMRRDKAQTWTLAQELGGDALVDLVREHTHSCYRGERTRRHDWGYGCAACPACELRAAGYARFTAAAGAAP
jgi:7-cyano-7-deazaguanine synthase